MGKLPIAVLISDVHYSVKNLELADRAMRMAIDKAYELNTILIVAGDLHDSKANLRGECVNAMLKTFSSVCTNTYILRGNHDQINERSKDHSLNFLDTGLNQVCVITESTEVRDMAGNLLLQLLPYHFDAEELKSHLKIARLCLNKNIPLIMHQGIIGSSAGHYIQDKSAITKEDVSGLRVISGHYHTRQTIQLPDGGVWDYIGNPYTLGFGEANDPPKGFQVLYDDGSLEFIPTNLRKHVIVPISVDETGFFDGQESEHVLPGDLVWVKVYGPKEFLFNVTKASFESMGTDFKLDLIPDAAETSKEQPKANQSQTEVLDGLVDSLTNTSGDKKSRLKDMWKGF